MGMESFIEQMIQFIKDISRKIIYMGLGIILEVMEENTKGNGLIIKCMDRGYLHERMEGAIKENIEMTRKKDLESFFGLLAKSI